MLITGKDGERINTNNQYEVLKTQRFISVKSIESTGDLNTYDYDLQKQRYFGRLTAMDEKQVYGFKQSDYSLKKIFDATFDFDLSILKKINVSRREIKKNDYQIERELYPLLNKKELKKEYPLNFELYYKSPNLKLRKIKIKYNKKFLPVKIYGYYEGEGKKGWHWLRTISYPYKNEEEFNTELADYIEFVERYEEENSGTDD